MSAHSSTTQRPAGGPKMRSGHGKSGSRTGGRPSKPAKRGATDKLSGASNSPPAVRHPSGTFRVLIAVHRPRYRMRAERAVTLPGWGICSLLNKQDPIGLMNQERPHLLILSDDFGRQKDLG